MRHRPTWNVGIGNADIWLLENVLCRAHYLHAKSTAKIMVSIAFDGLNASNGALVIDLAESVLAGDTLSPTHDG